MRLQVKKEKWAIPKYAHNYWQLSHNDDQIVHNVEFTVREIVQSNASLQYWTNKSAHRIRSRNINKFGCNAIGKAMKESSLYKRQFVSKHSTGHCSMGIMMKQWSFRTDSRCPRCKSPDESVMHVILCPHSSAVALWHDRLTQLRQWMRVQKTDGNIIAAILRNLKN